MKIKFLVCLAIGCILFFALCGCVNQYPEKQKESIQADGKEKTAVEAAKDKVKELGKEPRLIATSPAGRCV